MIAGPHPIKTGISSLQASDTTSPRRVLWATHRLSTLHEQVFDQANKQKVKTAVKAWWDDNQGTVVESQAWGNLPKFRKE